ncbi:N-acetylglucosamine-6-phosphate deacetylase [Oscillatoria sp. CS-180]|uniref:N-acetylglucosamine-6-phosphate deacetylase n=1 Tax=Oscillatoria sp. CS-180 TaxID=3021720 RepID=UPI00232E60FC|nr:N-acetylglucosamine-6-phosphate deacetylase [Oscillatoria sp. CS-180]MDB9528196.1 N-acetylglucosamine-6-phosphate deacetylase [Oscillatoria sp. CS-180]
MFALTNGKLYTGTQVLQDHALVIQGDHIHDILPSAAVTQDCPCIDLQGLNVAPGFVDLQLNGCGGVMFNDAIAPSTLDRLHQTNLRSGTTSFLPTLITAPDADMQAAMSVVQAYRQQYPNRVLGLHLEGPYLNPKRKGIHNGDYVRSPDVAMIEAIAHAGSDTVKLITLAPERVSDEAIQTLTAAGIVVSAGHTNANYEQALSGFDAGVGMVTHLFNAMSPWQSRSPGMVGAALQQPNVYAGIIADGHHVHFASIALAQQLKGDRLFLVTDATPPAGTQMESFEIGGQTVYYQDGKCLSAEGTLGGSALTMIEAIANCVRFVGIALEEALRMATLYPAKAIRVDHYLGQLAAHHIANLAIFSDDFEIIGVVDQGQLFTFNPSSDTEILLTPGFSFVRSALR